MEEVGSSGKVVLVLLAVEAGAVKEGSRFLLSRRVLGRAIKAHAIKAHTTKTYTIKAHTVKARAVKASAGSYHHAECRRGGFWVVLSRWVRILESGERGINLALRGAALFIAIVADRAITGARGCGS